ncbi:MAG TPA: PEP-CTERM sorting domain-containing protein, partial [Fimbriimonadaceae bacterium]|nr:PEP-CTERM sorting domain-containing protein [Fimbriimonadaceae bacterium]
SSAPLNNPFSGGVFNDSADGTTALRGSNTTMRLRLNANNTMTAFVEHLRTTGEVIQSNSTTFALTTATSTILTPRRQFSVGFDTGAQMAGETDIDPNNPWRVTVYNANLQAVPEPGTMIALGAGALALLRRRRRS